MAGIWETWSSNGEEIRSVAIITTEANAVVRKLHDRMPVMLVREEEKRWLDMEDHEELLDPFPDERTPSYEVLTAVNSPTNDGPELVEPIGSDQAGLREFT